MKYLKKVNIRLLNISRVTVNPYVTIFLGLDVHGGRKSLTDRQMCMVAENY